MNKCTQSDIQEMLPDLLHGTLAADAKVRVEAHVASCEECREDLDVLRAIKGAAIFAPAIDVDRVVRQIPPYRTIVPAIERPATTRVVSWLVAASLAVVVLGGGSLLMMSSRSGTQPVAVGARRSEPTVPGATTSAPPQSAQPITGTPTTVEAPPHTHALALAADVDGLSDGSLAQLMDEMSRFDALPATEPDAIISVDSGASLDQDSI